MTVEQKVSHLLRRFGLGAGRAELEKYLPLGVEGTIDRLINYEKVPDNYPVQIWEWFFQPDGKWNLEPARVRSWWQLRMLVTERPLEEKLTLFWHNHFAVSGSKVELGPSMYQYLTVLRENASGGFYDLLEAVSKTPAMLRWLDTDLSVPGHPNENFAREVMELFTLGIGNYTEKDVQEAARAFIGWGIRYPLYERIGGDQTQKVMDAIKYNRPLVAFTYTPDMCDRGPKTILGKTKDFSAEDVLKMLAYHPIAARRTMTQLWEFFGYADPEPALIDRLVKVWQKNDLQMKPVLLAMAKSNEFWSAKCVRSQVKSPVDFTIGLLRQFRAGEAFMAKRKPDAAPTDSMQPVLGQDIGYVTRALKNQGLDMLFPPDVAGWTWGPAWITAATIIDRIRVQDVLFTARNRTGALARPFIEAVVDGKDTKSSAEVVAMLLDAMDVELPAEKAKVLVDEIDSLGGPSKAFANPGQASTSLRAVCRVLFAAPEFQMC
jgi:uncharacterized protein (DUF1800 family)